MNMEAIDKPVYNKMSGSDPKICEQCLCLGCQNTGRFYFLYLSVIFTLDGKHVFDLYKIKTGLVKRPVYAI